MIHHFPPLPVELAKPLVAFCILLVLISDAAARFVVEEGGLKISFPAEAKAKYAGGFDMALANFGAPLYGGTLMGRLIYVDPAYGQNYECSPAACRYACQDFQYAKPKFDLRSSSSSTSKEKYIMLVDRGPIGTLSGPCKFAEKVWNAQSAGAKGVIVVNFEDAMTTMEAPDSDDESSYRYMENITIPASFITKSSGDALKGLLAGGASVYVSMDWTDSLPRQKQVQWEFWTNSNDECGPLCDVQKEFIANFAPVAKDFDGAGWMNFTPHYLIWTCPFFYRDTEECRSQCIRQGRYCAPDPDGSIIEGYSGAQVVEENLRQLCIHKLATAKGRPWLWWDYSTTFAQHCTMESKAYGQECSEKVFEAINTEKWSSIAELRGCIGDTKQDASHPVLESEIEAQIGDSKEGEVFILPTLRINGAQYRGKLAVKEVIRALCAGFDAGNRPLACDHALDDTCMVGGKAYVDCASRKDGKTQCVPTLTGYDCICGQGFISHKEKNGSETCLDINECLSISQLDPKCTCDRCACKNTFGGYECISNIPNECAQDHGGCWHMDATVKGQKVTFSACHDNLPAYREALSRGQPTESIPLHNCTCPPCFSAIERRGKITCEPRCNLDYCDLEYGVCHAEPGGKGGFSPTIFAVMVTVSVVCAITAISVVGYRLYMRGAMRAEVRAIMAQYMPLADSDPVEGRAMLPMTSFGLNGGRT